IWARSETITPFSQTRYSGISVRKSAPAARRAPVAPASDTSRSGTACGLRCANNRTSGAQSRGTMTILAWAYPDDHPDVGVINPSRKCRRASSGAHAALSRGGVAAVVARTAFIIATHLSHVA